MSFKMFTLIRVVVVMIVAGVIGWAVTSGNAVLPVPVAIAGAAILFLLLKRRVKEVVVDERIYTIAGKAVDKTYRIFGMVAALAGATLIAVSKEGSPTLLYIGLTLSYSGCGLVLIYYIFYTYYNKKLGGGKK